MHRSFTSMGSILCIIAIVMAYLIPYDDNGISREVEIFGRIFSVVVVDLMLLFSCLLLSKQTFFSLDPYRCTASTANAIMLIGNPPYVIRPYLFSGMDFLIGFALREVDYSGRLRSPVS